MVTHPEKVLFPDCGVSKGELCAYYEAIAPVMLPHMSGRPVTLERFPNGIGAKGFIQKDVAKGFPDWLRRVEVQRREPRAGREEEPVHYALAFEARDLVWMANQNSITPHVWASRVPDLDAPDCCCRRAGFGALRVGGDRSGGDRTADRNSKDDGRQTRGAW